jgi:hypothetical protein
MLPPAEQNAANLALPRERLVEGVGVCRMISWPEHMTGDRARTGKRQRDYALARWQRREFQVLRPSATTWPARALVAAGCPDQPWQMVTLDGTSSLRGRSLHAWARRVVVEEGSGFRIRAFAEHPNAAGRGKRQTVAEALPEEKWPPRLPRRLTCGRVRRKRPLGW